MPFALSFLCWTGPSPSWNVSRGLKLVCVFPLITLVLGQPRIRHIQHRQQSCFLMLSCESFYCFLSLFPIINPLEPKGGKVMKMTLKTALKRSTLCWTWVLPETVKQWQKHSLLRKAEPQPSHRVSWIPMDALQEKWRGFSWCFCSDSDMQVCGVRDGENSQVVCI